MRVKLLDSHEGRRSFAVIFDIGEEAVQGLRQFADERELCGSHFTAIGAFRDVVLGYWLAAETEYLQNPVREQVEVASLMGNIALRADGQRQVHAHIVVGKRDGVALAGHLLEGHVHPTLEVMIEELPEHLRRQPDERTGLLLLRP